jgi:Phospholipase_D-nuclease N-terminal
MKTKKNPKWNDIPANQRLRIVCTGIIQLVLTSIALWDLSRRPASQVKGKKVVWGIVSFIQPFGSIAYLLFGRKKATAT